MKTYYKLNRERILAIATVDRQKQKVIKWVNEHAPEKVHCELSTKATTDIMKEFKK